MITVNQAGWERVARAGLGAVLLVLAWGGVVAGGVAAAFTIVGLLALATGLAGWCPLYTVLGISTRGGYHHTGGAGTA